jgi:hypothetical protein
VGRRPPHRRLRRLAAGLAIVALVGSGCSRIDPATGDPRAGEILARQLNDAVRDNNQVAFLQNFSGDQAARTLAQRWYRVLSVSAGTVDVPPGGSLLETTWTLPGDRDDAKSILATSLGSRDGAPVITGVRTTTSMPIWAIEDVEVTPAVHGSVVSSGLTSQQRVEAARLLNAAVAAVQKAGVVSPKARWAGSLVVEEPSTAPNFRTVTGMDADSTAGVTTCDDGTARIVMSPLVGDDWFAETLVHEAVHVATDSPCGNGAVWAAEGLAEWVTERTYPDVARANADLVRDYLRTNDLPDDIPDSVSSPTDYALAAVAVEQVFAHLGHDRAVDHLDAFMRRGKVSDDDYTRIAKWYTAELARLKKSA